jgi:hypothetical protein
MPRVAPLRLVLLQVLSNLAKAFQGESPTAFRAQIATTLCFLWSLDYVHTSVGSWETPMPASCRTFSEAQHADAAPFDDCHARVGYWDGMDAERTIAEIECLERIFAEPDTRPLSPSDIVAANRRHDEMLAHSPWFRLWQQYGVCCRAASPVIQQPE